MARLYAEVVWESAYNLTVGEAPSSCWAGAESWTSLMANRAGAGYAGCGQAVAGQEEEVVDLIVGGQEALSVSGRLEPLHLAFASAGWLV